MKNRNTIIRISLITLFAAFVLFSIVSCGLLPEEGTAVAPGTTPDPTVTPDKAPVYGDNDLEEKGYNAVMLTDPFGIVYSSDDHPELLPTLFKITKNAEPTPYLGESADVSRVYIADFKSPSGDIKYKLFLSGEPDSCFFQSASGKFYCANASGCEDFLRGDYSEGAYPHSALPTLSINSVKILPTSMKWEYKRTDGIYLIPTQQPVFGGGENVGKIRANFKPNFSVQPDSISVVITDKKGNEFYSGDFSEVENLQFPSSGADYNISMTAIWEKNEKNDCAGECEYSFKVNLSPSAIFSIDRTSIYRGEFLILSCDNPTADFMKFTVSNDAGINCKPRFFTNNGKLSALLPVPLETQGKKIKYTVQAYNSIKTFDITISDRSLSQGSCTFMTKEVIDNIGLIENPYTALYKTLKPKIESKTSYSKVYALNSYKSPYTHKDVITRAVFGQKYKFNSACGDTNLHTAYENIYIGYSYIPVNAVADGKVVYSGTEKYTGGLVIVDHGMGLLSWYWNLSPTSITVKEGDIISKGSKIGYNGGGGFTETYNNTKLSVHVGLTVFDIPTDLNSLIS